MSAVACRQGEYQLVPSIGGDWLCWGPEIGPWSWKFVRR